MWLFAWRCFLLGILWNLFYGTRRYQVRRVAVSNAAAVANAEEIDTAVLEQQYTQEQMQAAEAGVIDLEPKGSSNEAMDSAETQTANQIAALRMERERSWQQLQSGLEVLEFADKQQCLKQYEELRYREQRLELLLKAKGIENCLALLEEKQANIIVGGTEVAQQYEKIYDLVQRNSDYPSEQIVIVPLPQIAGRS